MKKLVATRYTRTNYRTRGVFFFNEHQNDDMCYHLRGARNVIGRRSQRNSGLYVQDGKCASCLVFFCAQAQRGS